MEVLNVCVSEIPKEKIYENPRNGKKYVRFVVSPRREPDNYGNDLAVSLSQPKEERQAGVPVKYVGNGKTYPEYPRTE